MVFARYVMFSEVYWHHTVRSATCMFARAFFQLYHHFEPKSFFRKTEAETIESLRNQATGTECERLTEGIFGPKRILYKRVKEYSLYQKPQIYEQLARQPYKVLVHCGDCLAQRLAAELKTQIASTDVLIDAPPPHREIEIDIDIYFPKEKVYHPLHEVSPVVEALARTQFDDYVKRVRIFAHPRIAGALRDFPGFESVLNAAIEDLSQ